MGKKVLYVCSTYSIYLHHWCKFLFFSPSVYIQNGDGNGNHLWLEENFFTKTNGIFLNRWHYLPESLGKETVISGQSNMHDSHEFC